jgi:hypothetical protein
VHLNNDILDQVMVVVANLINLIVIGIFVSRVRRNSNLEHSLGLFMVSLAIPIGAIVLHNSLDGREWWTVVLPSIMVLYLSLEFALDYALKIEFRNTIFLWPYLIVFYAALMGLIGFAFLTSRWQGYVTLLTYFLGLIATWYSHSKVGHGVAESNTSIGSG